MTPDMIQVADDMLQHYEKDTKWIGNKYLIAELCNDILECCLDDCVCDSETLDKAYTEIYDYVINKVSQEEQ